MARNDITGKVIKTNPQTQSYRDGWDLAFAKKTAREWFDYTQIEPIIAEWVESKERISYRAFLELLEL